MIGVIMLAGSGVVGDDPVVTVSATMPKKDLDGNLYIKVMGAIGGTHSCSDLTYTFDGVKMEGPGAGKVMSLIKGSWVGSVGDNHSKKVNDTSVVVTYSKKDEPKVSGKIDLTVVNVQGKLRGRKIYPGNRVNITVKAKGFPNLFVFGVVNLSFSNLLVLNDNPYTIKTKRNIINFARQFTTGTKFNRASTITLSCPFGPASGRFPFGCTGVFVKNGMGVDIK